MQFRLVLGASLLAMALCNSVLGQQIESGQNPDASTVTADVEKAFKWFDTLGFPKLIDRQCVHLATGRSGLQRNGTRRNFYVPAFLLREETRRFTVFMLDLSVRTFEKTPDGTPEHERVGFADADLKRLATDHLRKIAGQESDPWYRWGAQLTPRAELFVLARACHAAGRKQLADELISYVISISDLHTGKSISIEQLQNGIADDISHAEMWRAFVDFGNPEIGRKELIERFRRISKHFPQSRHAKRAKDAADLLANMVKEDEDYSARKQKPLALMTIDEEVAELIYQLRDQNGHQWAQPGACDIFTDPRDGGILGISKSRGEGSPASQLVAIGKPALEQLIDSVDDDRFTRSVGFHRNFFFSHRVIRVGECCLTIINRIKPTGRVFDIKGDPDSAKRAMKAWYIGDGRKE